MGECNSTHIDAKGGFIMAEDYRKKLKEMSLHRQKYVGVIESVMRIYSEMKGKKQTRNLIDEPWIALLLELIDLGYLDFEVFTIEKDFGSVVAVYYNGAAPLTEEGRAFLHDMTVDHGSKRIKITVALIILAVIVLYIVYLLQ